MEEFQQKCTPTAARVTKFWAIMILCLNISTMAPMIRAGVGIVHYLGYASTTLVAMLAVVLVLCCPPKYATLIASIGAVLCSAGCGIQLH